MTREDVAKTIKLTKGQVKVLNSTAQENMEYAQAMLHGINMVLDTYYSWLNRRVVLEYFDEKLERTAFMDVWANAREV